MDYINLDYGTIGNIWESSLDVLFRMNATDNKEQCCKFKILGKKFEFRYGELFFTGKKVTLSTFDSVCRCLLARVGFMDCLKICSENMDEQVNCQQGPNNMKIHIEFENDMQEETDENTEIV